VLLPWGVLTEPQGRAGRKGSLWEPFLLVLECLENSTTCPLFFGAHHAPLAVVAVGGQAVAQQVRVAVAVAGRENDGEADGVGCGPSKDEGQGQQGVEPAGLAGLGAKLATSA
jgi:hypothetical protein